MARVIYKLRDHGYSTHGGFCTNVSFTNCTVQRSRLLFVNVELSIYMIPSANIRNTIYVFFVLLILGQDSSKIRDFDGEQMVFRTI